MMDIHTATENAYKNGYAQGKADAAREIFEELNKEYGSLAFLDDVPAGHIQLFITKIKKRHAVNAPDNNVGGKTECQADGNGEWISVYERLPEKSGLYLAWWHSRNFPEGMMGVLVFDGTVFPWTTLFPSLKNTVTHWMPLHEPPRGE